MERKCIECVHFSVLDNSWCCSFCRQKSDKPNWTPKVLKNMDLNSLYPTKMICQDLGVRKPINKLSSRVFYKPFADGLRATAIIDEVHEYMKNDVKTSYELYEEMRKLRELEREAKKIGCRVVAESWFKSVNMPGIEKVIFNDPATIVIWDDGTKTVVKAQKGELFDPEKGLAMAVSKKALGNKGNYFDEFKKWLPEEKKESTAIRKVVEEMKDPMWDLTVAPDESWKDALIEYLRNFEK